MVPERTTTWQRWRRLAKGWSIAITTLALGLLLGRGIVSYTTSTAVFNLERIEVRGNKVLTRAEIVGALELPLSGTLFDLDLPTLQGRIENLAYVYGVRLGRTFPHTLFVDVVENVPLAYVAGPEYFVVASDGAALPLPHGRMELELPTIAGIDSARTVLEAGSVENHAQLQQIRRLLRNMARDYPEILRELSELVLGPEGEVTLYLAQTSTAVRLEPGNMEAGIALLDAFLATIRGKRQIKDYAYIDLRYKRQIIVKERV